MGLRVVLDVPNIFEYMVNRHSDLADLRDAMTGKQHGPSQNDKIEMGRLFDHLLTQDRELHAETVFEVPRVRAAPSQTRIRRAKRKR